MVDTEVWGQPTPSVLALERELARVRRERAAHAREHVATVARAAVLNIVVIARRQVHALRAAETVATLAMRHPSRAIVVLGDAREEGPPGISPLLVPDLPLFLWWTETPDVDRPYVRDLLALAQRLIVDSADFARPERTLPRLATACVVDRRCALTDLNWARLTTWRELLVQFFDVPAWRQLLEDIEGVRVSFAVDADGREIHPSQALLLVGWLASRLGWRASDRISPSEAGGHLFDLARADGSRIPIRLRPRFERGLSEGDVSGIRIDARRDGRHTQFRIHRDGGRWCAAATVSVDDEIVSERIVPLPATDVVELLSEELTILASDRVFEEALALLVTLA